MKISDKKQLIVYFHVITDINHMWEEKQKTLCSVKKRKKISHLSTHIVFSQYFLVLNIVLFVLKNYYNSQVPGYSFAKFKVCFCQPSVISGLSCLIFSYIQSVLSPCLLLSPRFLCPACVSESLSVCFQSYFDCLLSCMHFVQVRFPFVVMSDLCLLCFHFSHPVVIMCIFKSSVSLCLLLHFSCSLVYAKS